MTAKSESPILGACLCGAVSFQVTPPAKFCAHCHCSICRRAHGAGLVTWAGFPEQQLKILKGEALLTRFKATPKATRTFCGTCGTQLFFQGERWPGEIHVTRASLPDHAGLIPAGHVFYSDKAPWLEMHDGLGKHGGPTGVEPLGEE